MTSIAPLDIVTAAMQDLGALALEETPTAGEAQAGLNALNDLLDAWQTESLLVYNVTPKVFTLTSGKSTYTMGSGGDFNTIRPPSIGSVFARDNYGADYPVYYTTDYTEFANIVNKATPSSLPTFLYDDGGYPLRTLTIYPFPTAAIYSIVLWVWDVLGSFPDTFTIQNLPPAYVRAIKKNLALEIAPAYGKEPSATLVKQASESKTQISLVNLTIPEVSFDFATAPFDWRTGYPLGAQ